MKRGENIGLLLGILSFVLVSWVGIPGESAAVSHMAAIASLMAIWWITEALPIAATALIPLVAYPFFGILPGSTTAEIYFNSTVFMFVGGFMIALTMERWNVHERIALWIILRVGGRPSQLVLGFMMAAAFLSMWISNTATAIMMIPIGTALIVKMEQKFGKDTCSPFSISLMLGIAHGCSVGGMATLVGTPPNLSFSRIYAITFPDAPEISFGQWTLMALPLSLILLGISWVLLTQLFYRAPKHLHVNLDVIQEQYAALGALRSEERWVLGVFGMTASLWIFRKPLVLGEFVIPGWSEWLPHPKMLDDGTIALMMALLLFLIPAKSLKQSSAQHKALMSPDVFIKIPWNIVLLFGGGFALATGFQETGLSTFLGNQFSAIGGWHPLLMILILCLGMTFLTELTSNTATTEMILPILASLAVAIQIHPLLLMIPATLSASCAFMMPVATPPNAIVFGSKRLHIRDMARVGIVMNLLGVLVLGVGFYFFGTAVFQL